MFAPFPRTIIFSADMPFVPANVKQLLCNKKKYQVLREFV